MKKIISLSLALMSVLMLAACKKTENEPDETTASAGVTTAVETSDPETAANETTAAETEAETAASETEAETDAVTSAPETTEASSSMDEEKAVALARAYLGEKDTDLGYIYSYQFIEVTDDGEYKIKVSWYIEEDDRYSTCGYLLVSPEGKVTKFDW